MADDITGKLSTTNLGEYTVLIVGRDAMVADSEVTTNRGKILVTPLYQAPVHPARAAEHPACMAK